MGSEPELPAGEFVHDLGPALGAAAFSSTLFAGLFEELALAEFLLNACVFDQLSESTNCVLDGFVVSQPQLDHATLLSRTGKFSASFPHREVPDTEGLLGQPNGPTARGASDRTPNWDSER